MTRKELSRLSNDELRAVRHKYLAAVGTTQAEKDNIFRTLKRIKHEIDTREYGTTKERNRN
jgi:hypothetical protein